MPFTCGSGFPLGIFWQWGFKKLDEKVRKNKVWAQREHAVLNECLVREA